MFFAFGLGANTRFTFATHPILDRLFNLSMMVQKRACHVHCSKFAQKKKKKVIFCGTRATRTHFCSHPASNFPLWGWINFSFLFSCVVFPHLKWILDEYKGKKNSFHFWKKKRIFQFEGFTNTIELLPVMVKRKHDTKQQTPIQEGRKSYRLKFVCWFSEKHSKNCFGTAKSGAWGEITNDYMWNENKQLKINCENNDVNCLCALYHHQPAIHPS